MMNASHDLSDSVDRPRLVKSGGARDDPQPESGPCEAG